MTLLILCQLRLICSEFHCTDIPINCRATTTARGVGRASKEAQDVARAKENVGSVQAQMEELDAELQAAIASLDARYHPATEPLETISLKPKRGGVTVQLVALVWVG